MHIEIGTIKRYIREGGLHTAGLPLFLEPNIRYMNIYVGNLAWKAKKQDLTELFQHFGEVIRAFIVRDKRTRRSKGFGFVEMEDEDAARAAIEALNNTVFMERAIVVNEAHPRKDADDEDTDEFDEEEES
jgi:RNA recognition motif-containing protein